MCKEFDLVDGNAYYYVIMSRRKQNCPKRMKWEEELAALAASAGNPIPSSYPRRSDDTDDRSDDESGDSEDEGELKVDEEEAKAVEVKEEATFLARAHSHSPASTSDKVHPTASHELSPMASLFGGMAPPSLPPGFPMDALAQSFLFGGGIPGFLAGSGMFMPPNFPLGMGGLPYGHPLFAAFANSQQQANPSPPKRSPSPVEQKVEQPLKRSEKDIDDNALDLSTYKRKESSSAETVLESKHPRLEKTSFPHKNGIKPLISPLAPSSVSPADATRALERMSELSRLPNERLAASRQSTWQNHWLSKGGDATRDVLKCVWCKQSFDSLAALTAHMRESKQCGMTAALASQSPGSLSSASSTQSKQSPRSGGSADMMKESGVQLPRKLVRGQDVWLGKGAEQTRQILKCMWCGQSFRSLAEMTSHMQQTQHYTNIISQEQIISWKTTDDKTSSTPSHVNAVLTCKVCDQAFSSLKELSNHMVKNSHYKEHIMRSLSETGGKRRAARDKRKKALPVRKLLELERAQSDKKDTDICEKCGDRVDSELPHMCTPRSDSKTFTSPSPAHTMDESRPSSGEALAPSPAPADNSSGSPSVLNALEKLIEKSFDSSRRTPSAGTSSMLKRLGIDDSHMLTDFSRPLIDSQFQLPRHRSPSESTSASERSESKPMSPLIKEEKMEVDEHRDSPVCEPIIKQQNPSPAPSSASDNSASNVLPPSPRSESGLSALGSMIDNLKPSGKAHPLAALQKLCDKTENNTPPPRPNGPGGAILAFSWACSDAIAGDSVSIKCTFCDTQFVSKGAYRHHLSKVHFVKDSAKSSSNGKASSQSPQPPSVEETPHAKFLKYSELAKQLSSKYV